MLQCTMYLKAIQNTEIYVTILYAPYCISMFPPLQENLS